MPATATMQIDGGRHRSALPHFAAKPGRSGWTVGRLSALRELAHSFRGDLTEVAAALGRDRSDCDIALNALLGAAGARLSPMTRRNPAAVPPLSGGFPAAFCRVVGRLMNQARSNNELRLDRPTPLAVFEEADW